MVLNKVFVTGGQGKIGKKLVSFLQEKNWQVTLLTGRLGNKRSLKKQLKEFEYVIHLAVYQNPNDSNYQKFYETNVVGTENLLEAVDKKSTKKIIYFSSEVVRDEPAKMDNYARSKSEALKIVKTYEDKLPIVSVFPSVVIDRDNKCQPVVWWQKIGWQLAGGFPGAVATLLAPKDRKLKVILIEELVREIENLLTSDHRGDYEIGGKVYSVSQYRQLMKNVFKK